MVYVPLAHPDATQLRAGRDVGVRPACSATPSLTAALGTDTSAEEADYAALNHAGVLALGATADPRRLVLAAEVAPAQVTDARTQHGEVEVADLRWNQVTALFADEAAALEATTATRRAVGPGGLAEALATPAVQDLLDTYDLLWFAAEELDQLL
ncbi:MAG TPA: hypothetical protein VIT20_09450 [Propionibacteriaceae bacterium]